MLAATLVAFAHFLAFFALTAAVVVKLTLVTDSLTIEAAQRIRRADRAAGMSALAVLVFGGATLAFRNQAFIQWKPTIFNWVLAVVFGASQFIGDKNLMERTLGSQLILPRPVWTRLNILWVSNFTIVGALNLVVAYGFSEATWVSYKLYSAIGFTLLLTVLTAVIISPHLKDEQITEKQEA